MPEKFMFRTKEATASEMVDENLLGYSIYQALSKLPNIIDGLKRVHRRTMWLLLTHKLDEEFMALKLLGEVSEIHPHGDANIYESIIRMMQPFSVSHPLAHGSGNIGSYSAPGSASAPRYLEMRVTEFAKDIFGSGIDPQTLKMVRLETDWREKEPAYLIPKIPTALIMPILTIGVGFKSQVPPLNLVDVCELVHRYVDCTKNMRPIYDLPKRYGQLFLPDFPIGNYIRNVDELLAAYARGQFEHPILLDGSLTMTPDNITLQYLPYGCSFEETQGKINKLLQGKTWIKELLTAFRDDVDGANAGAMAMDFKRNVDPFDVLERYKSLVKFTTRFHSIYNFVTDKGKIIRSNPVDLLHRWYEERRRAIIGTTKYRQVRIIQQILVNQAKLIIWDHYDEAMAIIRNNTRDAFLVKLVERFGLTLYQATALSKVAIGELARGSKDDLLEEQIRLKAEAETLMTKMKRVEDTIYEDATVVAKKYGKPRRTRIKSYLGYVGINGKGIIQFDDMPELIDILANYRNQNNYVHMYQPEMPHRYLVQKGRVDRSTYQIPQQTVGEQILESPIRNPHTLCFCQGTVSYLEGLQCDTSGNSGMTLVPVTETFTGVHQNGILEQLTVQDFIKRKSVGSRGTKTSLIGAIPSNMTDVVLFHVNNTDPNILRVDRVIPGSTKRIATAISGETTILGMFPYTRKRDIVFTIPQTCTTLNIEYVQITNLAKWLGEDRSRQIKLERKLRRHDQIRTMALL